jgi:hypothetical protein
MGFAKHSEGYPASMLELLLAVGSTKKPATLHVASPGLAHKTRLRFYCLRTALKREKYHSLEIVLSVRIRLVDASLIFESADAFTEPGLDDAFAATLAQHALETDLISTKHNAPTLTQAIALTQAVATNQAAKDDQATKDAEDTALLATLTTTPPAVLPPEPAPIPSALEDVLPPELLLQFYPKGKS